MTKRKNIRKRLTNRFVDSLPDAAARIVDEGSRNLFLYVTATGLRSWVLEKKDERGVGRTIRFGTFPALDVAAAREARDRIIARMHETSVSAVADEYSRRRHKEEAALGTTVGDLLKQFEELHIPTLKNAQSQRVVLWSLETVFGDHRDKPIADIGADVVLSAADNAARKGQHRTANLHVSRAQTFLHWCRRRGHQVPAVDYQKYPETVRSRYLSLPEVRSVLKAADNLEAESPTAADLVRLLIETGLRVSEVAGLEWSEVNLDWEAATLTGECLNIRGQRMKGRNAPDAFVPLSPAAIDILRRRKRLNDAGKVVSRYVFPAARTRGQKPVSGFSALTRLVRAEADRVHGEPIEDWRLHDLRRTLATHCADLLDIEPSLLDEAVLHHTSANHLSEAGRRYQRAERRVSVRKALYQWSDLLFRIRNATDADMNVMAAGVRTADADFIHQMRDASGAAR